MDGADAINYILQNNIEGVIIECGVENGNFELILRKIRRKESAKIS